MDKWIKLQAIAAPMMQPNIDTGALAPVIISRTPLAGWGDRLFGNWRYDSNGADVPDFVLNQPRYRGSRILVAGRNFACGSSRESAAWTLIGYGFRCVIALSFGEIFYENAFQNGLLLIILPEAEVQEIADSLGRAEIPELTVDLRECRIDLPDGKQIAFSIPEERRAALLDGVDELGVLLSRQDEATAFRVDDRELRPWIYGS
jgi:3-isopropylmalate/(R)-2-methylmalate dehydratase small subunit